MVLAASELVAAVIANPASATRAQRLMQLFFRDFIRFFLKFQMVDAKYRLFLAVCVYSGGLGIFNEIFELCPIFLN